MKRKIKDLRCNAKRVYKLNKFGHVIKVYANAGEAAKDNGFHIVSLYKAIRNGVLCNKKWFFSNTDKIGKAVDLLNSSKSNIKIVHDLSTYKTISDYRENLLITYNDSFSNQSFGNDKRNSIIHEVIMCTLYLKQY